MTLILPFYNDGVLIYYDKYNTKHINKLITDIPGLYTLYNVQCRTVYYGK